jgi:hypothetical protein
MKNAYLWLITIGLAVTLFVACGDNGDHVHDDNDKDTELLPDIEKKYNEEESAALNIASDVTLVGQQTLMANLVKAIEDSGTAGAVVFCNIHVGGIYDSLKTIYGATVSRVSHKNRNPANAANEREVQLIKEYSMELEISAITLFDDCDHYTAYKPIHMGIMACSKCHGEPGLDIEDATFITISMLYPDDKATGFKYKDMRGLWKVEVPKAAL